MKFTSDIDIDLSDRDQLLKHIWHVPATVISKDEVRKHNTGIYVTDIPTNPLTNCAAFDYNTAEQRGYIKLDLLNVGIYKQVKSEQHLVELMSEPDWSLLENRDFFEQIIHIGKHYDTMLAMPEKIDSIPRMAMFLSIIRPGKRHLIGKTWSEVSKEVWIASEDGYYFKQAHAISYANLVVVHMNLLVHSLDQSN